MISRHGTVRIGVAGPADAARTAVTAVPPSSSEIRTPPLRRAGEARYLAVRQHDSCQHLACLGGAERVVDLVQRERAADDRHRVDETLLQHAREPGHVAEDVAAPGLRAADRLRCKRELER